MNIVNGVITGFSIGGSFGDSANMVEKTVGGVSVKFEPGDLAIRNVQIGNQGMATSVGAGLSTEMTVNGTSIRSDNGRLWVNGEEVSFSTDPAAEQALREKSEAALAGVRERFPGVEFSGAPSPDAIGPNVEIERGAKIDLTGTTLSDSKIRASAQISGGSSISGSEIAGRVQGSKVVDSDIRAGASASSRGELKGSVLMPNSSWSGTGDLHNTLLAPSASVSGTGDVINSIIGEGASWSGTGDGFRVVLGAGAVKSGTGDVQVSELAPGSTTSGTKDIENLGSPITASRDFNARTFAKPAAAATQGISSQEETFGREHQAANQQAELLGTGSTSRHVVSNADVVSGDGKVVSWN